MNRFIKMVVICLCVMAIITGCSSATYISYTFSVTTGDSIKVKLNTTDNYTMTSSVPFSISNDDGVQSQGVFITAEDYKAYVEVVGTDESATLLDSGNVDGNSYIFWSYNDSEFNYAILVGDTNTGLLLGNIISKESAQECFKRLEISIAD